MNKEPFKNAKFGDKYKTRDGRTAVFLYQEDSCVYVFINGDRDTTIVAEDGNYMAAMPYCKVHSLESPQDIIEPISKQSANRKYYENRKAKDPDYYKRKYQRNKERILASCKRYRERNREKVLERNKKYNEAHREERNAYSRAYAAAHREELKARQRQKRLENGQAANMLNRMSKQVEKMGADLDAKLKEFEKLFENWE